MEDAPDVVWTLCSLAVSDYLVVERGRSADKYREWLVGAMANALLGCAPK